MLTRRSGGQESPGPAIAPLRYVLVLVLLVLVACSGGSDAPAPGTTRLTLVNAAGKEQRLDVEIADTAGERTTGLSGRQSLASNAGMLFVIPQHGSGFWMKDTLIPLSVAFLGPCGEIVAIADMEPLSLQLHDTDRPYSFGLEVNQGWFRQHNLSVGDKVLLPDEVKPAACT